MKIIRFYLEEAVEAHRQMENRQTTGKIVLFPGGLSSDARLN
jgi:hypothetical protein